MNGLNTGLCVASRWDMRSGMTLACVVVPLHDAHALTYQRQLTAGILAPRTATPRTPVYIQILFLRELVSVRDLLRADRLAMLFTVTLYWYPHFLAGPTDGSETGLWTVLQSCIGR